MRKAHLLAVVFAIGSTSTVLHAQKPGKPNYSHAAGKGTTASLPRHSDTSALVLQKNAHSGAAADLNRIEQQSLHSPAKATQQTRVRPSYVPKPAVTKGKQNASINFSGHSPSRSTTITKTQARGSGLSIPKPH